MRDGVREGLGVLSGNRDLSDTRAALWRDGVAIDLNSRITASGWLLVSATGINDVGQIVGTALRGGVRRAYLLTPDFVPPRGF